MHNLPDTQQSFWQLAVIQLSGWMSLPLLATSVLVLQENSIYGAALTIIVGNAILWFIRLAIILMSYKKRQSTLDLAREYLGKVGGYFIAVLLIISTLAWFIAQTTAASRALTELIKIQESQRIDQFTQVSVFLGVISTFLCMEGIVLLRKLTTYAFPILVAALVIAFCTMPIHIPPQTNAALSLSGLALVLGSNLGITSDLPTFFRHSRSLQTSITSITVVQLVSLVLSFAGLFLGSIITGVLDINHTVALGDTHTLLRYALVVLIFVSVICANVANVYSASVGWEVVAPKALVGRKEYLILGLGLTTIFILVSDVFSVEFLLNTSDSSLVNLCIILTLGYLISRLTKRLPNLFEQTSYFLAWLGATVVNTLQYSGVVFEQFSSVSVGTAAIFLSLFLAFLVMAFSKRTIEWVRT